MNAWQWKTMPWVCFLFETIATFLFVLVIMGKGNGQIAGLVIGLSLTADPC